MAHEEGLTITMTLIDSASPRGEACPVVSPDDQELRVLDPTAAAPSEIVRQLKVSLGGVHTGSVKQSSTTRRHDRGQKVPEINVLLRCKNDTKIRFPGLATKYRHPEKPKVSHSSKQNQTTPLDGTATTSHVAKLPLVKEMRLFD